MRPVRTGKDLHHDQLGRPPRDHIDRRNQPWLDPVADETGEALLLLERIGQSAHALGAVLDSDDEQAARRVGKGNQRVEEAKATKRASGKATRTITTVNS